MKTFSLFSCHLACLIFLFPNYLTAQNPCIVRMDGVGAGNNFLEIKDETVTKILDGTFNGEIIYEPDFAPIKVEVIDDNALLEGRYELTLFDNDVSDETLEPGIYFRITHLPTGTAVESNSTVEDMPVQEISEFGLKITVNQTLEPGQLGPNNGAIGATLEYDDPNGVQWFQGVPDTDFGTFNYVKNNPLNDPNNDLSQMGDGFFVPYQLCSSGASEDIITPVWTANHSIVLDSDGLSKLNNVNLVFTKDKSRWSRCVIIESASPEYDVIGLKGEGNARMFDNRKATSVLIDDNDGDGLPDVDVVDERLGMGWFPGYAIDVETGKRLNIYFGENSTYSLDYPNSVLDSLDIQATDFKNGQPVGRDMMWNPTDELLIDAGTADGFPYSTLTSLDHG